MSQFVVYRARQSGLRIFPSILRAAAVLAGLCLGSGVALAADASRPAFFSATIAPSLDSFSAQGDFAFASIGSPARAAVLPTGDHAYNHFALGHVHVAEVAVFETRFDKVAKRAGLSSVNLASLFSQSRAAEVSETPEAVAAPDAATSRLAMALAPAQARTSQTLAYVDPSPSPDGGALAAIAAVAPSEEDTALAPEADDAVPSAVPLPSVRPLLGKAEPEDKPGKTVTLQKPTKLAFAMPEDPTREKGGVGKALRKLFGAAPRPGNGVAVYDISAARVYMPDGSVLEAHSGIGKMADNPSYTHVRMNGPTPAHTYNLRMRETRFHGVEAIRMLPVDGKNKYGRDGFLTHSYLLRGGRAESHGCVAFKDYNKFLAAFKQGKVKQIVVVPGGGSAIARASRKARDI